MSRFEIETPQAWAGAPVVVTSYDWKAMGDAIEALEKLVTELKEQASYGSREGEALYQSINRLCLQVDGVASRLTDLERRARTEEAEMEAAARLLALEDRLTSIAADLSRLEQRTVEEAKAPRDPWGDGEYLVRWVRHGDRMVGVKLAGQWFWDSGRRATSPPHWIGPRVDLPK